MGKEIDKFIFIHSLLNFFSSRKSTLCQNCTNNSSQSKILPPPNMILKKNPERLENRSIVKSIATLPKVDQYLIFGIYFTIPD